MKTRTKPGILAALGLAGFLLMPRLAGAETTTDTIEQATHQNPTLTTTSIME